MNGADILLTALIAAAVLWAARTCGKRAGCCGSLGSCGNCTRCAAGRRKRRADRGGKKRP